MGQVAGDEPAEGEPQQRQRQLRILLAQPTQRSLGVIHLALDHVMRAGAAADTAIIEAQRAVAGVASGALQGRDHLVQHGAALDRVRVADQREPRRLRLIEVQRFKGAAGAVEIEGGFAFQQSRNSVTLGRVDSSC